MHKWPSFDFIPVFIYQFSLTLTLNKLHFFHFIFCSYFLSASFSLSLYLSRCVRFMCDFLLEKPNEKQWLEILQWLIIAARALCTIKPQRVFVFKRIRLHYWRTAEEEEETIGKELCTNYLIWWSCWLCGVVDLEKNKVDKNCLLFFSMLPYLWSQKS